MAFVRFYKHQSKLIIPTVLQAEEGFYMDEAPVTVCDITNESLVREMIAAALASQNEVVPTPTPTGEAGSAILEKLRIKKWRKFESEAVMYNVYVTEKGIEYYSTGNAIDGEWKLAAGKHISLAADTDHTRVVDIIVQELREDAPVRGAIALLPPPKAD